MSEVRIPSVNRGWSVEGRRLSPTYPQAGNKSKAGSAPGWKRGGWRASVKLEETGLSVCVKHLSKVVRGPGDQVSRTVFLSDCAASCRSHGRERVSKGGGFEARSCNSKIKGIIFRGLHPREGLIPCFVTALTLVIGLTSSPK